MAPSTRRARGVAVALLGLLPLVAALVLARVHAQPRAPGPRRVVLFVGDGMGLAHVTLGRLAAEHSKQPYAFDRMPVVGLADTRSANNIVTDSAAAATALSSGYKTQNGFLGVDPDKQARRTVLELARRAGFKTGLVTTTRITHATPAAFAAHVVDRNSEHAIAEQYLDAGVDVLLGGGTAYVTSERLAAFTANGYAVVTSAAAFRAAKPEGKLVGVFTPHHMSYELERDAALEPSLREMTEKALDLVSAGGGSFFLVVEGGKIDVAGHKHDAAALVREQLAFSEAIGAALERVERGGDLLVVVTADHTTGGLAISEKLDLDALFRVKLSAEELVNRHRPGEITANLEVFQRIVREAYGFTPTEQELELARRGGTAFATVHLGHIVSQRRGLGFYDLDFQHHDQPTSHGHEGSLVPVFAAGRGAEGFAGTYHNTRVPLELARLLGLPRPGEVIADFGKRFY